MGLNVSNIIESPKINSNSCCPQVKRLSTNDQCAVLTLNSVDKVSEELMARLRILNNKFIAGTLTKQEEKEREEKWEKLFSIGMNINKIR